MKKEDKEVLKNIYLSLFVLIYLVVMGAVTCYGGYRLYLWFNGEGVSGIVIAIWVALVLAFPYLVFRVKGEMNLKEKQKEGGTVKN